MQVAEAAGLKSLYQTIADVLGSKIPEIDFQEFENEMASIEAVCVAQQSLTTTKVGTETSVERIQNPKALCISSRQFTNLGFENQLQVVLNAFPAIVPHQRVYTSKELRDAISDDQKFDIVHIAAYVCPRSGDLYFSEVDVNSGKGVSAEPDVLSADALAALLQMAEAKLVVIGSCDSIALAATLVNICHVVAARDMVSPRMMAAWVEAFYAKLPLRSLSQALDYALKISQAPMRFYARQPRNIDLVFMQESGVATVSVQNLN